MKGLKNISVIFKIYPLAVIIFFLFRFILFVTELKRIDEATSTSDILYSFFMGIRFDIVICGYILVLPYLVLTLLELNGKKNLIISKILFYFIFSFFTLTFFICAADIPYFNQFFSRFSVTAFEWVNSPLFVIKMIAQEPKYWMTIIPFLILSFIFYRMLKRIWKSVYDVETKKGNIYFKAGISILFLGFIFLGIRGRIDEKSPIRVGTAYFCNNA